MQTGFRPSSLVPIGLIVERAISDESGVVVTARAGTCAGRMPVLRRRLTPGAQSLHPACVGPTIVGASRSDPDDHSALSVRRVDLPEANIRGTPCARFCAAHGSA